VKIYFASDFHLGIPGFEQSLEREKSLCRWLKMAAQDAHKIYLLGDCFDFWFEYKKAVPKGYTRLFGTISEITDSGIEVKMFKGNHDMWMFGYLEQECGVKIVSDEEILQVNGKKLYIHHGDGLGPGEPAYKLLRKIFRSALCQWFFARLHPNFGIWLALKLSKKSRLAQKNHNERFLGEDNEFLIQFIKQMEVKEHFDFYVFGHRHLAMDKNIGNTRYINLGEWIYKPHYAVFNGDKIDLLPWQG
jgi:UDP-2,3-diacylglucosamine hydrolase